MFKIPAKRAAAMKKLSAQINALSKKFNELQEQNQRENARFSRESELAAFQKTLQTIKAKVTNMIGKAYCLPRCPDYKFIIVEATVMVTGDIHYSTSGKIHLKCRNIRGDKNDAFRHFPSLDTFEFSNGHLPEILMSAKPFSLEKFLAAEQQIKQLADFLDVTK